jgi:hypothetical protein
MTKAMRRFIEETHRCLEDTDFHGASAALQRACAEAASSGDADVLRKQVGADDGPAQGGHEARKESEGWG